MVNLIADAKNEIKVAINLAAEKAFENGELASKELCDYTVEITTDASHGDFAANAAMVSARVMKIAPRQIAEIIKNNIVLENTRFEKIEVAGP